MDEAAGVVRPRDETTGPDRARAEAYAKRHEVYRSLYRATKDAMARLMERASGGDEGSG